MNYDLIIGVDPGWTGALSVLDLKTGSASVYNSPKDPTGMATLIREITCNKKCAGVIERIAPQPKFSCITSSKLGGSFYAWQALFAAYDVRHQIVVPKEWQKIIGGEMGKDPKEKSWRFARRLYPQLALDLGDKVPSKTSKASNKADALCILEHARRLFREE